ncbi:caspase family protein, partial [Eubacterium callanderi]|nr:caspase family protein [Eubacterium callanderi]
LYESVGLIEPVDEEHMYFAAMNSKSCRLTPLGLHYWKLSKDKRF